MGVCGQIHVILGVLDMEKFKNHVFGRSTHWGQNIHFTIFFGPYTQKGLRNLYNLEGSSRWVMHIVIIITLSLSLVFHVCGDEALHGVSPHTLHVTGFILPHD